MYPCIKSDCHLNTHTKCNESHARMHTFANTRLQAPANLCVGKGVWILVPGASKKVRVQIEEGMLVDGYLKFSLSSDGSGGFLASPQPQLQFGREEAKKTATQDAEGEPSESPSKEREQDREGDRGSRGATTFSKHVDAPFLLQKSGKCGGQRARDGADDTEKCKKGERQAGKRGRADRREVDVCDGLEHREDSTCESSASGKEQAKCSADDEARVIMGRSGQEHAVDRTKKKHVARERGGVSMSERKQASERKRQKAEEEDGKHSAGAKGGLTMSPDVETLENEIRHLRELIVSSDEGEEANKKVRKKKRRDVEKSGTLSESEKEALIAEALRNAALLREENAETRN